MTPRARIAYALKGGRCNSDAIDNSAGVNTSDVEVNIKIALGPAVKSGALGADARLALLRAMTDEVAALVLRNNVLQTLAISLEERQGADNLGNQLRLMAELEERGLLDRAVEQLPSDAALGARAVGGRGLTRPEIGTLLAIAKIGLSRDLAESDVANDPYLARELFRYFPAAMQERFADGIAAHRLRREIIATQLANSIVNRGGPTLPLVVRDRTGAPPAALARAYAAVRDSFGLQALHAEIDALDNRIPGALQLECYAIVRDIMPDRVAWFVRNLDAAAGLEPIIAHHRAALGALAEIAPKLLSSDLAQRVDGTAARLTAGGVPDALARRLAMLPVLARSLDVVTLADAAGAPLADAAVAYAAVAERLGLVPLARMLADTQGGDYYEGLALEKARDTLEAAHRDLARGLIAAGSDGAVWEGKTGGRIQAAAEQLRRITADPRPTVAKASVAASLLAEVAR